MPLTRCNIEQLDGHRWVAEVEMGGMSSARRVPLWATTFDDLMVAIIRAYDAHFQVPGEARIVRDAEPAKPQGKDLVADAEALGIRVDGRWSTARLAAEIAAARSRPVAVRDDH